LSSTFQNLLLDGVLRYESEDVNLLRLTDTMSTIHSLQIGLRVPRIEKSYCETDQRGQEESGAGRMSSPVRVVENDNIGRDQVDTETSSTSSEQEDEFFGSRLIVSVDLFHTIFVSSSSVESTVFCEGRDYTTTSALTCNRETIRKIKLRYSLNKQ
jgi:hypothetical protein